jgi:enolase
MNQRVSCISAVTARQIFDSRGRPTVEADVTLKDGSTGRACAPSGTSTGRHEAWELRDGDPASYGGLGVLSAVAHVRGEIATRIIGMDALDQAAIDHGLIRLDGSSSLRRLGANAVLAASLATARAAASHLRRPLYRYISQLGGDTPMSLPMPMTNILSGRAPGDQGMDFQDFLVIPVGAGRYADALAMISRVGDSAAGLMKSMNLSVLLADDGGFSPGFSRTEQALELMVRSFEAAGLRPGADVAIGLDVAASQLLVGARYRLAGEGRHLSSREMIDCLVALIRRFPIVSVEDPLDQDDWEGWREFTLSVPGIQVVGDDLFATNLNRITKGIGDRAANSALIKLNQNGTVTGTLAAMAALRSADFATVVAARSGETEDTFVSDLAVGSGAGQIKIGSFRNTERLAKYNQLLRIEEESGLPFAGVSGLSGRLGST